jgi:hypothetical protein
MYEKPSYGSVRLREWKVTYRADIALRDLATDPGRQVDRWPQRTVVGRALKQMLDERHFADGQAEIASSDRDDPGEIDPGVEEKMRALGCIE